MSNENVQKSTNRLIKFKTLDNNITEMTVDAEVIELILNKNSII